jgi:hypothetical protein
MKRHKFCVLAGVVIALGVFSSSSATYAAEVGEQVVAAALSADNSLAQLSISGASLSPEFYYKTVKYTATVPYDVTEVEVTAKTSNAKASIESVSGNEELSVGENKIKVVVIAENGNEATYTITVTRLAEGESADSGVSETAPADNDDANETAPADTNDANETAPDEQDGSSADDTDQAASEGEASEDASADTDVSVGDESSNADEEADEASVSEADLTELSAALDNANEEYANLLTYYNSAVTNVKQLKQKIRLMTAVFLFIVVILLIIIFSILSIRRKDVEEEDELSEDFPETEEDDYVNTKAAPEAEEPVYAEEAPAEQTVTITAQSQEPETNKKTVKKQRKSTKKKKRRDSILAYLGLDDDLPLDYGDVIEDEDEEETEDAAERGTEKNIETPVEESASTKADADRMDHVGKRQKKGADNTRKEDIEFIDL